ncbi:hypothetical protein J2X69_004165 [Algoriphagus sp. 4150]|uniref:FecR family protein n=1 Tax=Algoriphagus sp. 4150 TaxID=2817756 RepID=UPI00285FF10A|nr:FecR domain-containing protein [Algoriphagus sp. 4150]MDR7131800.1 hypothetical protein [Algoriphagus sp. 4150]
MDKKRITDYLKVFWKQEYPRMPAKEMEASWERFSEKAFKTRDIPLYRRWYAVSAAAAAVLILLMFTVINLDTHPFGDENKYVTVQNTDDRVKILYLPDSTTVRLQPESTLHYAENFVENRSVKLLGEAFFDVVRDEGSPFTVEGRETRTKVLGTSFHIQALPEKDVIIQLYEGSVEMEVEGRTDRWELVPGEQFIYTGNEVDVTVFTTYRDFENTALNNVMAYILDTYGYSVAANESLLAKTVTLRVSKSDGLRDIIGTIATIYGLKIQLDDNLRQITLSE